MVEASALEPGQPNPQLQGQTQATAQPNGTISISELSLLARLGTYNVTVTLPDYPLVSTSLCFVCYIFMPLHIGFSQDTYT